MKEKARQAFYNGPRLHLGFTLEEVEKSGHRTKKKIIVGPVEAEISRHIFDLYAHGDGQSGPMEGGDETPQCQGLSDPHGRPLRDRPRPRHFDEPVYVGAWSFNKRNSKTLQAKPQNEIIPINVPAIIDR